LRIKILLPFSKDFLNAFKKSFENGNLGFHLCPSSIAPDENIILDFINNLFNIPKNIPFFRIRICHCENVVLYIDPRYVDEDTKEGKYAYKMDNNYYINFCYDL